MTAQVHVHFTLPTSPTSSKSRSSSVFSNESFATASSSPSPSTPPDHYEHARLPAAPRAIRLPLKLPNSPVAFEEVDVTALVLDDDMAGIPTGYIVDKLRSMGPELLAASTATCLHIPSGSSLPEYLVCTMPSERAYAPTHIFAVSSPDSTRTLLLPIHGLLWAARSPSLSVISSHPRYQRPHISLPASLPPSTKDDETALPVVRLHLPSSLAFPLLHSWIYMSSPGVLMSSILPSTSNTDEDQDLSTLSTTILLSRISLLHGLWQDVVALEIGEEADPELWKTMREAWSILVGALARAKRQQRA